MFKLLVIAPYYRPAYIYGGPVRSIPALCEGIAASGVSVTVFTTDANGRGRVDEPTSIPVQVDGVEVWYFPRICSRVAPMFFYSPELSRKCDAAVSGFDGVYIAATWTYPMLAGARAAHRSGVPYVVSPMGSFMHWSMSQKAWKKRIYLRCFERGAMEHACAIHCTSDLEAEQTRRYGFSPLFVVPNAVQAPPMAARSPLAPFGVSSVSPRRVLLRFSLVVNTL